MSPGLSTTVPAALFHLPPLLIGGNPFDSSSIYAMIHYLEREWDPLRDGRHGALVTRWCVLSRNWVAGSLQHRSSRDYRRQQARQGHSVGRRHHLRRRPRYLQRGLDYLNLIPGRARGLRNNDFRYNNSPLQHVAGGNLLWHKKLYRHEGKLAHHNIILSERYRGLLADIFDKKVLPRDFSLYLHVPTLTDPSIAPDGHEGFTSLARAPIWGRVD